MRLRIHSIATVALVSLLPLAAPLQACCDDFWSCVGAVASGGLTCAVESLVNSVRTLIDNVSRLTATLAQQAADVVNLARTELGGAANDLRNLASQAENDFNAAAQLATTVLNEASRPQVAVVAHGPAAVAAAATVRPGGAAPAPMAAPSGAARAGAVPVPGVAAGAASAARFDPPVDPQELLEALRRAKAALDDLRPDLSTPINQVRQFASQAEQQAQSAATSAAGIAESALLSPLRTLGNLLTDLVSHPERIFDPSRIVDDAITQVTSQVITTMSQVHEAVMHQAKMTLDQARQPLQDALDRAAAARKIADAMQRLQRARTRAACDALNAVVPRQHLDARNLVVHVAGVSHPTGITALNLAQNRTLVARPFSRIDAAKLTARTAGTQMSAKLKGPWQEFKRLQAAPPPLDPSAKPKVDAEIQRRFAGKTPEQAEAEKRALLAEARNRFAKDPKLLAKVEALLEGQPAIRERIAGPRTARQTGQ